METARTHEAEALTGWRATEADQAERLAAELERVHQHVQNAEQILERRHRPTGATEARSFAALLRSEINTLRSEASELRATHRPPPLPVSITTRGRRRPAPDAFVCDFDDVDESGGLAR